MLCNIGTMASVLCMDGPTGAETGVRGAEVGTGAGVGVETEVEAYAGALALVLRDPRNVMIGSSGFQQFFLM